MKKIINYKELIIITLVVAALFVAYFVYALSFENKVFKGVQIGDTNLSNKNIDEVEESLSRSLSIYDQEGITFFYQGQKTNISPTVSSFEPDLAYPVVSFKTKESAETALNFGRNGSFLTQIVQRIRALISGVNLSMKIALDENKIKQILQENYASLEFPARNAALQIELTEQNPVVSVSNEELGKVINYDEGFSKLRNNLANLENTPINLTDHTDYPQIYKKDTLNVENTATNLLRLAPIELSYNNRQWLVDSQQLADWLTLSLDKTQGVAKLALDADKITSFLTEEVSPNINKDPIKADFKVEGNKVTKFQLQEDGLKLQIEDSVNKIKKSILEDKSSSIDLAVEELHYDTSNNLDLGIEEILGTGHSDFSGSPANRRHNIETGAAALDGILIKPGQEFSLVETLGEIDAAAGYLPELVIKGNKTIPEYGGGLCQIGTTVFRTALSTGLNITERRNHSYRVSYYEPAGTDATIYDPWPDFKFINNTKNYVMIQSRIEGNDLYFDFWGTNDGRIATTTYPVIYNITEPQPTKYVETEDLDPGVVKCTERAHNGADAYFDYTVTYPETATSSAEVKEERFYSHYVPWQEVCLIGKAATSTNPLPESNTATSTIEQ